MERDFEIDNSLFLQGLRFWFPERYANKTDKEIISDYDTLCVLTINDMKTAGDEHITMIEDTLHPIKELAERHD